MLSVSRSAPHWVIVQHLFLPIYTANLIHFIVALTLNGRGEIFQSKNIQAISAMYNYKSLLMV